MVNEKEVSQVGSPISRGNHSALLCMRVILLSHGFPRQRLLASSIFRKTRLIKTPQMALWKKEMWFLYVFQR
ncbi:hypothetical protein L596_000364 [Steinernema carpocapsae]|uniref:Uncharacterized protein n=1 Tax=Steinernema carpocapsae TaxID=34508 RepID=A0A4U8UK59_STECR|nr:hypothetical protein L596_000364 [Steinernema carpocapsae]